MSGGLCLPAFPVCQTQLWIFHRVLSLAPMLAAGWASPHCAYERLERLSQEPASDEDEPHTSLRNRGQRAALFPCPLHSLPGACGDPAGGLSRQELSLLWLPRETQSDAEATPWPRPRESTEAREPGQRLSGIICPCERRAWT